MQIINLAIRLIDNEIELNEILCGIEKMGRIVTVDGTKASLTLIVKSVEEFLNIKLGDPQEIKRAVFRRKINITKFTDAIRNTLLKYSKELDR